MRLNREIRIVRAGGRPYDLGYEHGRQCKDLISALANDCLPRKVAGPTNIDRKAIRLRTLEFNPFIEENAPHLLEEIRGIAAGAGIEFEDALALQCRSELVYRREQRSECTAFAVTRERSLTGGVIVGQNVDLAPEFEPFGVVLDLRPASGPAMLTWTLAGTLGQVGLNSYGLARCGNVLFSEGWRIGLPTTVLWRLILEQPSVDAAVGLIARTYRAKSNNFVLGDSRGEVAAVEATVSSQCRLDPVDGVILHTNHYRHNDLVPSERNAGLSDSEARLTRLQELFELHPGRVGSECLRDFLRDHSGSPHCICKHEGQSKTVASVIAHPKDGRMELCPGNPCSSGYQEIEL